MDFFMNLYSKRIQFFLYKVKSETTGYLPPNKKEKSADNTLRKLIQIFFWLDRVNI